MEVKEFHKTATIVGKIFKLFEAGHSVSEIAAELKMPESTVRYYMELIDNDTTK